MKRIATGAPGRQRLRIPFRLQVPQRWRERFDAFWSSRNPREQVILAVGAVVMVLVAGYSLLWEPAAEGRAKLQKTLPAQRAELAEMQTLAQEARGLSAKPAPALRGEALTQALQDSLEKYGLKATRLTAVGDSTIQLQLDKVPFGAVAGWLQDVRQQQRLKVSEAKVEYVGATAVVNVNATLQGPGAGAGNTGRRN